jgi:hypothetical protein
VVLCEADCAFPICDAMCSLDELRAWVCVWIVSGAREKKDTLPIRFSVISGHASISRGNR